MNSNYFPKDKQGNTFELGRGPLPQGAEDGFDPNVRLASDGNIVHKTTEEKARTKIVPKDSEPPSMLRIYTDGSSLKNGQAGARAGVGVFFGPQDPKYDLHTNIPPKLRLLQKWSISTSSRDFLDKEQRANLEIQKCFRSFERVTANKSKGRTDGDSTSA